MKHFGVFALGLLCTGWLVACRSGDDAGLISKLNEASEKVTACQRDLSAAREEAGRLKQQLAQAMLNPGKVVLTDPETIELVAQARARMGGPKEGKDGREGEEVKLGKGDLSPAEASKVVMRGAPAMQACYERALKKNASLQYQTGIPVTLGITVKATGSVQDVSVAPSVDREMTQCIKTAAARWKFPPFAGPAVTIEQGIKLTPKT